MESGKKVLFPVIEVPAVPSPAPPEEQNYKSSLAFDFAAGDFVRDGANRLVRCDGREAYRQWCVKTASTERMTCLSYSADIGVEQHDAMTQDTRSAVESALERTITEALMVNPRTEYVRGFTFSGRGDELTCEFDVKGRGWEEQHIQIVYTR